MSPEQIEQKYFSRPSEVEYLKKLSTEEQKRYKDISKDTLSYSLFAFGECMDATSLSMRKTAKAIMDSFLNCLRINRKR